MVSYLPLGFYYGFPHRAKLWRGLGLPGRLDAPGSAQRLHLRRHELVHANGPRPATRHRLQTRLRTHVVSYQGCRITFWLEGNLRELECTKMPRASARIPILTHGLETHYTTFNSRAQSPQPLARLHGGVSGFGVGVWLACCSASHASWSEACGLPPRSQGSCRLRYRRTCQQQEVRTSRSDSIFRANCRVVSFRGRSRAHGTPPVAKSHVSVWLRLAVRGALLALQALESCFKTCHIISTNQCC